MKVTNQFVLFLVIMTFVVTFSYVILHTTGVDLLVQNNYLCI